VALTNPARIRLERRVEWIDTDAAGVWHWTTASRLAEAAEAALHTALGIEDMTFGFTPRVAVGFDFRRALRFNDRVTVELAVDHLGRSSIRYAIVMTGPDGVAVEGRITACLVARSSGRPTPWPARMRALLSESGEQRAPD
jgi:acyl-CoA thioester hydrolase